LLLSQAYGPASLDGSERNSPQRCYWLASVSKQFTAAAVLRLVDQGKLGLDDPLRRHLADAPPAWGEITVRQLLAHRSGIPNFTDAPDYAALKAQPVTPRTLLARFRDLPLNFVPGAEMRYSNSGYAVLAMLIEAISGRPYGEVMQAEIFGPAGMRASGELRGNGSAAGCAQGMVRDAATLHQPAAIDLSVPLGAGNLYGTTADLWRWQRALYGGALLKPASLRAMTTPVQREVALGLMVENAGGRTRYQHSGGIDGFSTYLLYEPHGALTVAVLGNEQGAASPALANKLARVARGERVTLSHERRAVTLAPAQLTALAGSYALPTGEKAWVLLRGEALWARVGHLPWMRLEAASDREFFAREQDLDWRFERRGSGPATALRLPDLAGERRWPRSTQPLPSVAAQPLYLRGSMNDWGQRHALGVGSDGLLRLGIELPAGTHSFKIASADWATFDWGGAGEAPLATRGDLPLADLGNNLSLSLAKPARCEFAVDGRDVVAPRLSWVCAETGP
jgi:CubicO group peptidase (beta-lactamase class C family)